MTKNKIVFWLLHFTIWEKISYIKTGVMNKFWALIILLNILFSIAKAEEKFESKRVVISGRVLNFNADNNKIIIVINRVGFSQEPIESELDNTGNFKASFQSYIPTDVWIAYNTNVLILTHPGDSLYVEFDGKQQDRPDVLKTIKFNGDAARINQEAAAFQYLYFSNPIYYNWDAKDRATKLYDLNEYKLYLDSLKQASQKLFEQFVTNNTPTEETKIWALTFLETEYYNALASYPSKHQSANNLTDSEWDVPISYYETLKNRLPITRPMLISGYALINFINRYHHDYTRLYYRKEFNEKLKKDIPFDADSILVFGIIKYTPDTLLRQMVLTEFFRELFDQYEIDCYERFRKIVDLYIQEPYLREPLLTLYQQTKEKLLNPKLYTTITLNKIKPSPVGQIMDSIVLTNKGKVIYIDCWATWCGPCRAEMPKSKELMKQMEDKDVAFVYVCLDSEEKTWKASLDKFQLGGQHYLLSNEQSDVFRKVFELNGIPHYMLFDKNGTIIEKGSHLRPDIAKIKIEELLLKN